MTAVPEQVEEHGAELRVDDEGAEVLHGTRLDELEGGQRQRQGESLVPNHATELDGVVVPEPSQGSTCPLGPNRQELSVALLGREVQPGGEVEHLREQPIGQHEVAQHDGFGREGGHGKSINSDSDKTVGAVS